MEERDYNTMSEHGITDQDYADQFGLPQALVGTPAMNDWMINKIYEDNLRNCQGELETTGHAAAARKECLKMASKSRDEARKLLKSVQKRRGY
jgi:hypothetical protein